MRKADARDVIALNATAAAKELEHEGRRLQASRERAGGHTKLASTAPEDRQQLTVATGTKAGNTSSKASAAAAAAKAAQTEIVKFS